MLSSPRAMELDVPLAVETANLTYRYGGGATTHTRAFTEPKLEDVTIQITPGSRVLISGANGAGKSTLMSIVGGKKMISNEADCKVLGRPTFHDTTLDNQRMYCGDWWRTNFFHNIQASELIGVERLATPRVQKLIDLLQINISWRINSISDGQRRRIQILEALAEEKDVYVLDEITTDLDVFAREELLKFLKSESEERGATILYATHIFDQLAAWATHICHFSKAKCVKFCAMADLQEYHALVQAQTRVPLYVLMKEWVFREYPTPAIPAGETPWPARAEPTMEMRNMDYRYAAGLPLSLKGVSLKFHQGNRVLLVGANGSSKSTVMSILGGKRLVPRGTEAMGAEIFGKDCFNDGLLDTVTFCGDWWNAGYFMNLSVGEVLGELRASPRTQHLVHVLQVDLEWKINSCSDGQRRRCQLLELLSTPRPVYLMDEITSDLDLFAREGVLQFLKAETELSGATIVYCTHIFDHLEGWPTHVMQMSQGEVKRCGLLDEDADYRAFVAAGESAPLYAMVRKWVYEEYTEGSAQPWRNLDTSLDGRVPNLGLAGPFQAPASGLMHA